jgi:quercetin dioxygenase-like cupin family protein
MRSIPFTLGALCAFVIGGALAQTTDIRRAKDLDWKAAPAELPRGAEVAVLFGDPQASGPFVVRLRAPAGYQVPAHKHPDFETVTVISGSLRMGQGQKVDPSAEAFLHAGDFIAAAPGMGHWLVVNDDAVVQVTGMGPWTVDYFDPRDNPRRKGASLGADSNDSE